MNNTMRIILSAALMASLAACSKKVKEEAPVVTPEPTKTETPAVAGPTGYGPEDLDTDSCLRQRVVYFDFDKAEIKAESQAILACHGKYLTDRPMAAITLEGHADERGTREYNISLSARRATASRNYLIQQGVPGNRISSIAYGKERPAALCDAEECWSQNRRAVTVITGGTN